MRMKENNSDLGLPDEQMAMRVCGIGSSGYDDDMINWALAQLDPYYEFDGPRPEGRPIVRPQGKVILD